MKVLVFCEQKNGFLKSSAFEALNRNVRRMIARARKSKILFVFRGGAKL